MKINLYVPARFARASLFSFALLAVGAGAVFAQNPKDCGDKLGEENIAACTAAIRQNPRNAYFYASRGISFDSRGEHDRAIVDFNEALKISPNYAGALANRGDAYRSKKEYDRAMADYNQAIRFRPTYDQAFFGRGLVHKARGDNARAIADIREALRLSPKDEDYIKALRELGVNP